MCFSGLDGCNKDLSGFVLSYHSCPDDLIAEVYQMFFYSHRINDILQYGARDQFVRMMTYSCSLASAYADKSFGGCSMVILSCFFGEPIMVDTMFRKYDVMSITLSGWSSMDFLEGIYKWNKDVILCWCECTNILAADLVVLVV